MSKLSHSKVDKGLALRYYKRPDIQELLIEQSAGKEIGMRYGSGGFAKRPDVLIYPRDVLEVVKRGITSFHCSEETWADPLALATAKSKKEQEALRVGWDLVLDIDCAYLEYSALCADLVIKFLSYCNVPPVAISCKFSGNKGFHIAIPFEAFPTHVNETPIEQLFPHAARAIAEYIKVHIEKQLAKAILAYEQGSIDAVRQKTGLDDETLFSHHTDSYGNNITQLNVESFLEIDTILISSRHLYRMAYSLHEKSGLLSLPLNPQYVLDFRKPMADPAKFLEPLAPFLQRNVQEGLTQQLFVQALDFMEQRRYQEEQSKELEQTLFSEQNNREFQEIALEHAVTQEHFPPCILLLLKGLEDGKKRAIFVLINFLGKLGWSKLQIKDFLLKWNKEKNPEPLRDQYILGQLRHYSASRLPPNCSNDAYYTGLNVCQPDGLCKKIKNPVNYSLIKWKIAKETKEREEKQQLKEERKKEREAKRENQMLSQKSTVQAESMGDSPKDQEESRESAPVDSDSSSSTETKAL